jgi:hypothetical protein
LNVHKINSSRDHFSPKLRKDRGSKQQSASGLKKVTMHTLNNTVLSMSIDTRVLRKSALFRKKVTKRTREVLRQSRHEKHEWKSQTICEPS